MVLGVHVRKLTIHANKEQKSKEKARRAVTGDTTLEASMVVFAKDTKTHKCNGQLRSNGRGLWTSVGWEECCSQNYFIV